MSEEKKVTSATEWEDIPAEKFQIIGTDDFSGDIIARPKVGYWADAWRRFRENKIALVALIILIVLLFMVIFGPAISGYNFEQMDTSAINQLPSSEHWFGTDSLGRDLFARVWQAGRVSLAIGIVGAVVASVVGSIYGGIASYFGGIVDDIMMRIVDIISAVPTLLVVVLLSVVLKAPMDKLFLQNESLRGIGLLGPGLFSIFIVISLLYWTNMARMTRGQILALKGQEFVTAARALGTPHSRIIFKHLIPNAMGAIIVSAMVQIPNAIFVEAFLSFLGLGVSAPMVSLGSLTSNAVSGVYSYPYQLLFPAALISIIILCFNLVGDGLRDALDPRMKNR